MIIDYLEIRDFRVFSGAHKFDLSPRSRNGVERPIILFGGLNGSGKTSVLTALKLALYGKGMLGTVGVAEYHDYLKSSIHKAPLATVKPGYASVELGFRYAQQGALSKYRVKRDWALEANGKVKEGLHIYADEKRLTELSYDQAQAFLNELIPLGVSELFFFDGEKIMALAEETTGEALRSSIEKLLGLDIISRLDSDLAVLVRTRAAKGMAAEKAARISSLESEYASLKVQLEKRKEDLQFARASMEELVRNSQQLQKEIDARGGAWSSSRQEESARLAVLTSQKRSAEDQLRELAGGLLPLAVSAAPLGRALGVLLEEQERRESAGLSALLKRKRRAFEKALDEVRASQRALDAFDLVFGASIDIQKVKPLHDLSDSQTASIEHRLQITLPSEIKKAKSLAKELAALDEEIDAAGLNISRAPDEEVLRPLYADLNEESLRLGEARAKFANVAEDLRQMVGRFSDMARQLDGFYAEVAAQKDKDRVYGYADSSRALLKEFTFRTTERKIVELEQRFIESFGRLARKKDINLSIQIHPSSYEVTLHDDIGNVINKNALSAGEKQIYAISILEALARTSGRRLPVIIDTPLGRLDSHHRKNLVDNYFPSASHQVLILSTDTEVDRSFYSDLSPSVSHAFHLSFDPETRSTQEQEGYFWSLEATA